MRFTYFDPDISETQEMRENLQRQLQEIMSATKLTTGRRTSVRLARIGSGGAESSPHTPDGSRAGRSANRRTLEALRYEIRCFLLKIKGF